MPPLRSCHILQSISLQKHTLSFCSTMGSTMGRSSSPKTVDSTSRPAALHLRRFHRLTSSPSSSSSSPPSPREAFLHA